jgi:ankyrin repeat protein
MNAAVHDRNLATLRRYLKAGADPLSCDYDKRTPLHVAAAEGNLEALKVMVEATSCATDPLDRWAGRGGPPPPAGAARALGMR